MATAIIKWVIQKAGTFLVADLKKELFGDASAELQSLLHEVIQLEQTIITIELEDRILPYANKIAYWIKELNLRIASASRGHPDELNSFIIDIANADDGVGNALLSIHNGLTGKDGFSNQGLLENWNNAAYSRLSTKGDTTYTVASYIQEMDNKLQVALGLYRSGIVLLTLTTKDDVLINEYCREWKENMVKILDTVFGFYPPALKLFKPSYDVWTPIWFRLQRHGTSQYLYHDSKGGVLFGSHSGPTTEWQFNPAVSAGFVGLVSREGWQLKIQTYSSSQGMTGHTENLKNGFDVVFKLIPLNSTPDAVVQLVGPYDPADHQKFDCSANKNLGVAVPFNDWVLQVV